MLRFTLLFLAPLSGLLLLSIGSSFLGTLLILQLHNQHVSPILIGLLTSFFYAGYIIGAFKLGPFIVRVGHIRAYATFASIMAVISVLHGLTINPYSWLGLRIVYGLCNAGLFVVVESWLLNLSTIDIRGRVLSLYMITFYIAQAFGQGLLKIISIETLLPYSIITMLASISVIPLCATRASSPQFSEISVLKLKHLFSASKSGPLGCLVSGLILGAIYGILPMTIKDFGFSPQQIGTSMSVLILGGALLQYPIGKLSDFINRRNVLTLVTILTFLSAFGLLLTVSGNRLLFNTTIFFFGGFSFVLYPIAINLVCDFIDSKDLLAAVAGLLIFYSIGSTLGPFLAPLAIKFLGVNGLFYYFSAACSILLLTTLWRTTVKAPLPIEEQGEFVMTPRTTPVSSELNPRSDEDAFPSE